MRVKYAVLCDYALVSRDEKVSIIGIFDEINPPILPFALPSMFLAVTFEAEAAEAGNPFNVDIQLWTEDGLAILSRQTTLRFREPQRPGGRSFHNEIMGVYGLPLQVAGDYAFIIMVNGEERHRVTLRVNEPRPETEGATNE